MTPEEILRELHDIHLPEQAAESAGVGFVFWPVMTVIALILLAGGTLWRRRSSWRREVTRHLDAIEQEAIRGHAREGWTDLALLLRRVAVMHCGREDVAGLIGDAWLAKLDQLFETDMFSRGPGRGVAVYPYGGAIDGGRDQRPDIAGQLRATIEEVRRRIPRLRTVRSWS